MSMDNIAIDMQGWEELRSAWDAAPQIVQEELGATMAEADGQGLS